MTDEINQAIDAARLMLGAVRFDVRDARTVRDVHATSVEKFYRSNMPHRMPRIDALTDVQLSDFFQALCDAQAVSREHARERLDGANRAGDVTAVRADLINQRRMDAFGLPVVTSDDVEAAREAMIERGRSRWSPQSNAARTDARSAPSEPAPNLDDPDAAWQAMVERGRSAWKGGR